MSSEQWGRLVVGVGGLVLVVLGVIAIFCSSDGVGAAALVTVGSTGVVGSMLWTQIESATIGPIGIKKKAEAAEALARTGEVEQAEVLWSSIDEDLSGLSGGAVPKGQRRAFRLEDAVAGALLELGITFDHRPVLGRRYTSTLRPDFTFETAGGKRVVVEATAPASEASANRLVYSRLLALMSAGLQFDTYLVIASPSSGSIKKYLRQAIQPQVQDLANRHPNVTADLIVVDEPEASQVKDAVSGWLEAFEPAG